MCDPTNPTHKEINLRETIFGAPTFQTAFCIAPENSIQISDNLQKIQNFVNKPKSIVVVPSESVKSILSVDIPFDKNIQWEISPLSEKENLDIFRFANEASQRLGQSVRTIYKALRYSNGLICSWMSGVWGYVENNPVGLTDLIIPKIHKYCITQNSDSVLRFKNVVAIDFTSQYANVCLEYPEICPEAIRNKISLAMGWIKEEKEKYKTNLWKTLFLSPFWGSLGCSKIKNVYGGN